MDAEASVRTMLKAARERLDVEIAYFSKFTEGCQRVDFVAGDARPFPFGEGTAIPLEETYCRRMVEGTGPSLVPDTSREPRMQDLAVAEDLGAYLGVPVRLSDGRIYGTLCCAAADARERMSARDEAYVQDLADGLATLVEQAGDTAAEPARRDDHVQLSLWFAGMTRAPASARAALTELDPTVDPDRLQALQLVVTELVTNSLRHAGIGERDVIGVDVRVSDGVLRCTVSDPGRGFDKPDVVKPHTDRAGGFGLVILESVAESWELIRDGLFGVRFDMRL